MSDSCVSGRWTVSWASHSRPAAGPLDPGGCRLQMFNDPGENMSRHSASPLSWLIPGQMLAATWVTSLLLRGWLRNAGWHSTAWSVRGGTSTSTLVHTIDRTFPDISTTLMKHDSPCARTSPVLSALTLLT